LIDLCYWIWKESGHLPDIRLVARMDRDYINDMMNYDSLVAYETTMLKMKTG
jgi:hypothetical protein